VERSEAVRSESWEARLDEIRHYLSALPGAYGRRK